MEILSSARREGLWDTKLVELCSTEVIRLEEADAGYHHSGEVQESTPFILGQLIPEHIRVFGTWAVFADEEKTVAKVCLRRRKLCKHRAAVFTCECKDEWEVIEKFRPAGS